MAILSRVSDALTTRRLLLFCAVMLVVNWISLPGEAPEPYDPSSELRDVQTQLGDLESSLSDLQQSVENVQSSVDSLQR